MMNRYGRLLLVLGGILLLIGAARPARVQGPEEGWQVYTNGNYVNDLALEAGGALDGGYTWAAADGGIVCYSASEYIN